MAAARGRVMTRSHITRMRAAIWLLMVALVESAPPRRLLGFSAGFHVQKPSPPPVDPWRTLYSRPPLSPYLKEYQEMQAYQAEQDRSVRHPDGLGLFDAALNQFAKVLKKPQEEKAPDPVLKGPAKCPPGVVCLDGVILTMPDHTELSETLKSDLPALKPPLVSPKPTKLEVAMNAAATTFNFLKPMRWRLSPPLPAPPPPPPSPLPLVVTSIDGVSLSTIDGVDPVLWTVDPQIKRDLDSRPAPPPKKDIDGIPISFAMDKGFQPPNPPSPPLPPPPPPLFPPMPPPPFRPPLAPPSPPVAEQDAEEEAPQEEQPKQEDATAEAAVEDSSGGGDAAGATAAEEASHEASQEAPQEEQPKQEDATAEAAVEDSSGGGDAAGATAAEEASHEASQEAPAKAKLEVQEENPKRTRKSKLLVVSYTPKNMHDSHMMAILLMAASGFTLALFPTVLPQTLQKLRALTGAKQTKTSEVPAKGSARVQPRAVSAPARDEDDEPSSMRELSLMMKKIKGRRANMLSRLKAISNDG